jgi:epoxyqueuosine reductase
MELQPAKVEFELLSCIASDIGLDFLSVAPAMVLTEDMQRLTNWQNAGHAGELTYMQRPCELLGDPAGLMPQVISVISFRIPYPAHPVLPRIQGHGRVGRYALGRDYHKAIRKRLLRLTNTLKSKFPQLECRVFTDSVPLLERAQAREAGLGFHGKNTMLIRKGEGSFFFIAEVLINAEIVGAPPAILDKNSCKSCTRCSTACPTNALVSDYVLDARKCISYLTIEKRGVLAAWEQEALGEWLFGCDICQEVCPFNHKTLKLYSEKKALWDDFQPRFTPTGQLSFQTILSIKTDKEFLKLFAGMPIMRTKRDGLIRNCAAVIANQNEHGFIDALLELGKDNSHIVRHACLSAAMRLCADSLTPLRLAKEKTIQLITKDENELVRQILIRHQ